jgi:hypothetical protein
MQLPALRHTRAFINMEQLFSPCTRLYDLLQSQGDPHDFRDQRPEFRDHPELLRELDLDVSTEELLSAERAFTYADLHALLGNEFTVLWLTPHAAVVHEDSKGVSSWHRLDGFCRFSFSADGKAIDTLALSPQHSYEISDVVLRLLAARAVHSVILGELISRDDNAWINAPTLAYFMEQCQSLRALTLQNIGINEERMRVLGTYSRPDLEIELALCDFTNAGTRALVEVLGRNQGPTKLDFCDTSDYSVVANGLRENRRLKSLTPRYFSFNRDIGYQEVLAIASALKENKGLIDLNLSHCVWVKETWDAVCDSLKTHPALQLMNLRAYQTVDGVAPLAPAVLMSRIQALVDMLKVNMSIHTMHLDDQYSECELFRGSAVPYLETNRLRPRLLAIKKTGPFAYRFKVLGRALLAVRTDPNRFWMLLSGNAEVAFPSTTAMTTTVAAILPTPTAAAAAAAGTAAISRATSTTGGASTVGIVAIPAT